MYPTAATDGMSWSQRPYHRLWLLAQANGLFDFFGRAFIHPRGGFYDLDMRGKPLDETRQIRSLHTTARAVHCFAIGTLLGRPGAANIVDHGMNYLWNHHRDRKHGGYFWSLDDDGAVDANKQGYGHAFVLLAASSAKVIGHPLADDMLEDITDILTTRFWETRHGAIAEEFTAEWVPLDGGTYRGQNSNMHLTEALMAAFEATGDRDYLSKAESIADLVIRRTAGSIGWRVGEHFNAEWMLDKDYRHQNEMFRPAGTTPGHALEWARLVLQLWVLGERKHDWMPEAAKGLFSEALALGWDKRLGGFFYTLDWQNNPARREKLWWPLCEGAAAAHFLNALFPSSDHEKAYRQIWDLIERYFIDHEHGGWHEERSEEFHLSHGIFPGKGDIYHALQACLIPLYPATGSLTRVIAEGNSSAERK